MLGRLRRIPGHLRPRRLRLYGVGNGKSGTTTLAQMFDSFRAAHELDLARLRPVAAAVVEGELEPDSPEVRAMLRRRSWRFNLEVDSANHLTPFAGTLADLYPDAKLVLLVRDCFSWLDARVEWDLRFPPTDGTERLAWHAAQFTRYDAVFGSEEAVLRDARLRPLASYLRRWAEATEGVLRDVPEDRLLVVRTEDLGQSAELLARFAGIPESTVHPAHANRNDNRTGLLGRIPAAFVLARAQEHCAGLMERYWGPEWSRLTARLADRSAL